jgi:hypothetical protein
MILKVSEIRTSSDQTLVQKNRPQYFYPLMIKILFIIGGLLFLSRIIQETQMLDIFLAPVAVILIFFTMLTKPLATGKDRYNILAFSLWIIASYLITIQANSELLFIFILVGFLIIQELSQEQVTPWFQKRLNIVLIFFVMVFIVIIVDKIHIILAS